MSEISKTIEHRDKPEPAITLGVLFFGYALGDSKRNARLASRLSGGDPQQRILEFRNGTHRPSKETCLDLAASASQRMLSSTRMKKHEPGLGIKKNRLNKTYMLRLLLLLIGYGYISKDELVEAMVSSIPANPSFMNAKIVTQVIGLIAIIDDYLPRVFDWETPSTSNRQLHQYLYPIGENLSLTATAIKNEPNANHTDKLNAQKVLKNRIARTSTTVSKQYTKINVSNFRHFLRAFHKLNYLLRKIEPEKWEKTPQYMHKIDLTPRIENELQRIKADQRWYRKRKDAWVDRFFALEILGETSLEEFDESAPAKKALIQRLQEQTSLVGCENCLNFYMSREDSQLRRMTSRWNDYIEENNAGNLAIWHHAKTVGLQRFQMQQKLLRLLQRRLRKLYESEIFTKAPFSNQIPRP